MGPAAAEWWHRVRAHSAGDAVEFLDFLFVAHG